MRWLLLLAALVLAGCSSPGAGPLGPVAVVDSTRWVDPGYDTPTALTWGYSRLNLWLRVTEGSWCRQGLIDHYTRLRVNLAGTADLPSFWLTGPQIHGVWTAVYDPDDVFEGGSFDLRAEADTLLVGSATVNLRTPCGTYPVVYPIRMIKQ